MNYKNIVAGLGLLAISYTARAQNNSPKQEKITDQIKQELISFSSTEVIQEKEINELVKHISLLSAEQRKEIDDTMTKVITTSVNKKDNIVYIKRDVKKTFEDGTGRGNENIIMIFQNGDFIGASAGLTGMIKITYKFNGNFGGLVLFPEKMINEKGDGIIKASIQEARLTEMTIILKGLGKGSVDSPVKGYKYMPRYGKPEIIKANIIKSLKDFIQL